MRSPGWPRLLVATALASWLAGAAAWGHTFPPVRTVVVQVEPCELVLLVGYRPQTGAPTEAILTRVASAPKSHALDALRDLLGAFAMAPLKVTLDGTALVPTSVRAKVGIESDGARPAVVLLVTYALRRGGTLAVSSSDPRTTRISWTDRASGRVAISGAPAQGKWFAGVASFLLKVTTPSCATSPSSSSRSVP